MFIIFIIFLVCILFIFGCVKLLNKQKLVSTATPQKATLSLSNPPWYTNSDISVNYSVIGTTTNKDWVGLFDQNNVLILWKYTTGNSIGAIKYVLPKIPGRYIFRYYINNTQNSIGESISFIIINKL